MSPTPTDVTTAFANFGVPAILIAFAVWCAFNERLARVAKFLGAVTIMHFAFVALWAHIADAQASTAPVIGSFTTGQFVGAVHEYMITPCVRVWVGFADYTPVAHDQIAFALRWIVGGTA